MTDLPDDDKKPSIFDVAKSTLSAAIGIQKNTNRERDFKHGNIKTFAIAGLIFIVLFIGTIVTVVNIVIANSK